MTEQTEGAEVGSWARQHHIATGHRTRESLTDPGTCLTCDERSPAYDLTEQARKVEVTNLADEIVALADMAFPFPGELDSVIADDIARAVLASDWLAAREAAAEVRGAQAVLAAVEGACDLPEAGGQSFAFVQEWWLVRDGILFAARAAGAAAGGGASNVG